MRHCPLLLLILLSLLVVPSAPAQAKCEKDHCWGSIAFSRYSGYWVYSMNHATAKAARSRAWQLCNKRCTSVVSVQNGCLAFVVAPRGRYTTAEGQTAEVATENALRKCRLRNKDCTLRVARCTADFEEIKRRAKERATRPSTGRSGRSSGATPRKKPATPGKKTPPANVEELKL